MAEQTPSNPAAAAPPFPRLVVSLLVSCTAGVVAIAAYSLLQHNALLAPDMTAALLGSAAVLAGGVLGLLALKVFTNQGPAKLAFGVLACSAVRLLSSLFIALGLFYAAGAEKKPFWWSFLVAGLFALILESVIINRWLPRSAPAANS